MARCYVRNGVWGWSVEDQEKALTDAGVLELDRLYRDILPAAKAKMPGRVHPEWLSERTTLLRPSGRRGGETIHVATLLALAVNEADLIGVLAAAAGMNASIKAIDSGITVTNSPAGMNEAVQDWLRAKATARTKPGRTAGYIAAAAAKKERTLAKLPDARIMWARPSREFSTEEIAQFVGLSVKTLYSYLGRREVAQKRKRKAARG